MAIHTERLVYSAGNASLEGYLAYDAAVSGERPGIVVFGEWWGRDDFAMGRARALAKLGYVALAGDVYGDATVAADAVEAGQLMSTLLADMNVVTDRVKAAIELVRSQPQTDSARIGVMGYCLGGALSLHAARLGVDVKGVVSFHGTLGKTHEAKPGDIKARILVCHAGEDAFVPAEEMANFRQEMDELGVQCTIISYPGALHAFTNPEADSNAKKYGLELAYDRELDKRSWSEMRAHWEKAFA
jgi:dienelactone hydrolase